MATISEDYVSFETAELLKEKGFDEGCSFVVNSISKGVMPVSWPTTNSDIEDEKANLIALPTLQMAMKWLREVHKLYITISHRFSHNADQDVCFSYYINIDTAEDGEYMTYEEACEAAIKYCLENIIQK